jgi:hypothetical protein
MINELTTKGHTVDKLQTSKNREVLTLGENSVKGSNIINTLTKSDISTLFYLGLFNLLNPYYELPAVSSKQRMLLVR